MSAVIEGRFLSLISLSVSLLFASACSDQTASNPEETTDFASMVLTNGAVYTMDEQDTVASALAIRNGEIVYVGEDAAANEYVGNDTQVIDLAGKMVVPGFVDGHSHPPMREISALTNWQIDALEPNLEVYREGLRAYAVANPDKPILTGFGLQLNAFKDDELTAAFIDEIVSDRPVLLTDNSGHGMLVNTIALEMSNITRETQDPPGGRVYRDEDGNPTGYLSDASSLLSPDFAREELSPEDYMSAWRQYENVSAPKGITAVQVPSSSLPPSVTRPLLAEYFQTGDAKMRVNFLTTVRPGGLSLEEVLAELKDAQQYVSDWQMVNGVKIWLDGVPEGKSAYLLQPYAHTAKVASDYRGTLNWPEAEYNDMILTLDAEGYQMQAHAMGDASARLFIDGVARAAEVNGTRDARHTMIHANLITMKDIERMGDLGIYAAVSPLWSYREPVFGPMELKMLGKVRYYLEYQFKKMVELGVIMSGSADQPVTPDDRPLFGIEVGVTRSSPYPGQQGDPSFVRDPEQALSVMDMLAVYTINGAKQMHMEHLIGSLEPGKKADLVILEKDITAIDPADISETKILQTIVDGRTVYTAN